MNSRAISVFLSTLLVVTSLFIDPGLSYAAVTSKVIRKVNGGFCGTNSSSGKTFIPYQKSGSTYSVMSTSNSKYKKLKSLCSKLIAPKLLSFKSLPSPAYILAKKGQGANSRPAVSTVSGTPPTIIELGEMDAREIYYTPGVIDRLLAGTPTEDDCSQVWSSSIDGASGGMSACRAAQNVGEGMGNILQSETTICYMKSFPSAINQDSSVGSLVKGRLPSGGWKSLFDSPASRDRLIEVVPSGMGETSTHMFLKISSEVDNLKNQNQYRVEFFACEGGSQPSEAQEIAISTDNSYKIQSVGTSEQGDTFSSNVTGKVRVVSGHIEFDPSAKRSTSNQSVGNGETSSHKNSIEIDNGRITTKKLDYHGSIHKEFAVAEYTGSEMTALRFLAGAFYDSFSQDSNEFSFQGAVEYRDTGYRAAPTSQLISLLPADLSDSFFQTTPTSPKQSSFDCDSAQPDISITLDMESNAMQQIRNSCEGLRFESRDFCNTTEMQGVQEAYFNYCRTH